MKKLTNNYWFLSLLSGILLWLAWPPFPTAPLVFIGFLPLFRIQQLVIENNQKNRVFWFYTFAGLLIWNSLTTWWVWHASPGGAIAAIVLNAVLMSLPWLLYHITSKNLGHTIGYISLVVYWLGFEYLHLNWQVSWPWLTLGNVFASAPNMVQWYQYTGFLGGSVWVLAVSILAYKLIINYTRTRVIWLSCTIILPLLVSYFILNTLDNTDKLIEKDIVNTSVIQPNVDPYTEKFGSKTPEEQLAVMLELAQKSINKDGRYPQTRLVLFPETSLVSEMDESKLNNYNAILQLREFCRKNQVSILTGASTMHIFEPGEKLPQTARKFLDAEIYYEAYNTGLLIDSTDNIQIYHKSKLVPGVESLPYPNIFKPIEKLFDLGGTSGSLGIQDDAEVLTTIDGIKIAPIICYESVYGHWVGSYVRQGADLLCIITNDGWWRNTPGYRQHLQYARLRAIETRRNIARSANTGISGFIDYKGEILEETGWWVPAQLNGNMKLRHELTFYARTGDYIGEAAAILSILTLLFLIITKVKTKRG